MIAHESNRQVDSTTEHHIWLQSFLFGRHVALVGGSDHWCQGQVNNYDIVIRVNSNVSRQGGRCDGLYASGYVNVPLERVSDLYFAAVDLAGDVIGTEKDPHILMRKNKLEKEQVNIIHYYSSRFAKPNPYSPCLEWCNAFSWSLDTQPFTGLLALKHLTLMPVKSIYVTGFDFYQRPDGLIPIERPPHKILPQLLWMRDIYQVDHRIVYDDRLHSLLCRFGNIGKR